MQQELRVDLRVHQTPEQLELAYSFENASAQPILVFDRLWDMSASALKQNWAHVEIQGGTATIQRAIEQIPQGLHLETPAVPYGREIAAHATGAGKFSIELPLKEAGEYFGFMHRGVQATTVPIHEIKFELGWCLKPASLPPAIHPVELNKETLWLLPYGLAINLQVVASSAPVRVELSGQAFH